MMRSLIFVLFFILSTPFAISQEPEKWQRLITLDNSVVDMNVSTVVFSTGGIGRVQFRFSLSKAQLLPAMPDVKYKSFIETIEYKCSENLYRIYEITYFDEKGKAIRTDEKDASAKWKPTGGKSFIDRLCSFACRLIDEKKRNP